MNQTKIIKTIGLDLLLVASWFLLFWSLGQVASTGMGWILLVGAAVVTFVALKLRPYEDVYRTLVRDRFWNGFC